MDAWNRSNFRPCTNSRGPFEDGGRLNRARHIVTALLFVALTVVVTGCSLILMANKMVYGDPVQTCAFTSVAGVDLVKQKKSVAVICTIPAAVETNYPSVGRDILENVSLRLKREGVHVISADSVLDWLDDNNGIWSGPDEFAEAFDADYLIHIELVEFTHKAENSPQLYQGTTRGYIRAYRIVSRNGRRKAEEVFTDEDFQSVYPEHYPKPASTISGEHFLRKYIKRISTQLAQMFYNYHASETVY